MSPITKGQLFLGRVARCWGTGPRFGRVVPLARACEDSTWELIGDANSLFPDEGTVFWFEPPEDCEDRCFGFEVGDQPSYDGTSKRDRYRVLQGFPALQVIDLRAFKDSRVLRRAIVETGVPLPGRGEHPHKFMLLLEDDIWAGPVRVVPHQGGVARWVLDSGSGLEKIQKYRMNGRVIRLETQEVFGPATPTYGTPDGVLNWEGIRDTILRLLKRLRKFDQSAAEALGITERVMEAHAAALADVDIDEAQREVETVRNANAQQVVQQLRQYDSNVREIVEMLLEIEPVKTSLAAAKQGKTDELRAGLKAELRAELSELTKEIQLKAQLLVAKGEELAEIESRIDKRQQEFESEVGRIDKATHDRLAAIGQAPQSFIAETMIVKAALGLGESTTATSRPVSWVERVMSEVDDLRSGYSGEPLTNLSEIQHRLTKSALRNRVPPQAINSLHAAFLAGCVPIVYGPASHRLVASYAAVVSGGETVWAAVSAGTFQTQDLLGTVDTANLMFHPNPSGLTELLLSARESSRMHVVVLEGFNRAPVESYLTNLLDAMDDGRIGSDLRSISLVPQTIAGQDNGVSDLQRIRWPSNVLPVLLPVDGPSVFGASSTFLRRVVHLAPEFWESPNIPTLELETELVWVSHKTWCDWSSGVAPSRDFLTLLEHLDLRNATGSSEPESLSMLCSAMQLVGFDANDSMKCAALMGLAPPLIDEAIQAPIKEWFRAHSNGGSLPKLPDSMVSVLKKLTDGAK